jgi:phenylacetate-CoA ligase
MTEDDMANCINLINRFRPKMIRAYADAIYEISRFVSRRGLTVKAPELIHTGAGVLHDFMRGEIERVFGCPVYDHYGSREVGSLASECSSHDGLHIMMEHNLIEVLATGGRPCRPGEPGEIVVTNLNNYAMPLIRYKIGDIGIRLDDGVCPCGCTYPRLKQVIGRTGDIFIGEKGQIVLPAFFIHLLGVIFNRADLKKFQVIQKEKGKLIVKFIAT